MQNLQFCYAICDVYDTAAGYIMLLICCTVRNESVDAT